MVDIDVSYEGELRCTAEHGPSSATLTTDAPVDNHGRGQSFSPTDLVATGLGTCMATLMGIVANKNGWNVDGTKLQVKKHMTSEGPRRIAKLDVAVSVPPDRAAALDEAARERLEHAANTCPVRLSIEPAIEVPVAFRWGDEG